MKVFRNKSLEQYDHNEKLEEVYIPDYSPEQNEIVPKEEVVVTSSIRKIVRYFNTLYELRLILIDGPIKKK